MTVKTRTLLDIASVLIALIGAMVATTRYVAAHFWPLDDDQLPFGYVAILTPAVLLSLTTIVGLACAMSHGTSRSRLALTASVCSVMTLALSALRLIPRETTSVTLAAALSGYYFLFQYLLERDVDGQRDETQMSELSARERKSWGLIAWTWAAAGAATGMVAMPVSVLLYLATALEVLLITVVAKRAVGVVSSSARSWWVTSGIALALLAPTSAVAVSLVRREFPVPLAFCVMTAALLAAVLIREIYVSRRRVRDSGGHLQGTT